MEKGTLKKPKCLKKKKYGIQSESSAVPGMLSLGMQSPGLELIR